MTEQQKLVAQIAGNIAAGMMSPTVSEHIGSPDLADSIAHRALILAKAIVTLVQRIVPDA